MGGDDLDGGTNELPAATIGLVLGCNLAGARVQSRWCYRWCDLGSALGGTISLVLRCDETNAIWGWGRWCDLGLLLVQSLLIVSLSLFYFPRVEII